MQIKRSWRLILAIGLAAGASTARAQNGPIMVHLANGDALPLQETKLTYEYQMWAKDTPRVLAPFKYYETTAIVLGKDRYPVAGTRVSFDHSQGRVRLEITQANGKKKEIKKVKAPERKVLLPDLDKNINGGVLHRRGASGGSYRVLAPLPASVSAGQGRALGSRSFALSSGSRGGVRQAPPINEAPWVGTAPTSFVAD